MGRLADYQIRTSRGFIEEIQAEYVLKSGVEVAQGILSIPEEDFDGIVADHQGQLWAQVDSLPNFITGSTLGEVRINIVDDDGKFNLLSCLDRSGESEPRQRFNNESESQANSGDGLIGTERSQFLLQFLIGAIAPDKPDEVMGLLMDFMDKDKRDFRFKQEVIGRESSMPNNMFYNRPLYTFSELLLIPGFTPEIVSRLALFTKIGVQRTTGVIGGINNSSKLNINTVPDELLRAIEDADDLPIGFLTELRSELSYGLGKLGNTELSQLRTELSSIGSNFSNAFSTTSAQFTAYIRVKLPNSTHWAKATFSTSIGGSGGMRKRNARLRQFERL